MFKEKRIAGSLTSVMAKHRLVIHPDVIDYDVKSIQRYPVGERQSYSLLHQMSKLVEERGALKHDDRLDALAGAISVYVDRAMQDDKEVTERKDTKANIEFLEKAMYNQWSTKFNDDKLLEGGSLGNMSDRFKTKRRRR